MEVDTDKVRTIGKPNNRNRKKTPVTVSLGPELLSRVDTWAAKRNVGRSAIVSMALTEGLDRWERDEHDQR